MPTLKLVNIEKRYGKMKAVDGLNLEVREGELLTLLGPSGCGKTTTLRTITGFVSPDQGRILLGGRDITMIPPEKRGMGLVFQNYALWPHMTVFQNLAFGLQLKRLSQAAVRKRVEEGLALVKLSGYQDHYPRQLSGGQQQRVALARALVLEPEILLLDEPLSNLDALLREQMRFEIAQIHRQSRVTTLYVTHDQTEAMVISDRIAVLNRGKLMQLGSPEEIYSRPANRFVAGFMGATSFIPGKVSRITPEHTVVTTEDQLTLFGSPATLEPGAEVAVAVRPEHITLSPTDPGVLQRGLNLFEARVERASYVGEMYDYQLSLQGAPVRARGSVQKPLAEGERVQVFLDPRQLAVLPG